MFALPVAAAADPAPLPVKEVAPGIFVYAAPYELASEHNDGAIANVSFVVGRDAVAVIDTGNSLDAGRRLKAAVRAHTALPIRYVINTHMHPDHVLGNKAFADDGVTFVAHAKLPRALAARAERYLDAGREALGPAFAGTEIVMPTRLVETTMDLDLGGRELVLEAHPTAHTDNDLTIFDPATGTMFMGDLLFIGHIPTIDGSTLGWLKVLDGFAARDDIKRAVPGHGPAVAPWPEAIEAERRYFERLAADTRALVKQGLSIDEAARTAGQSERGKWELFDEFNPRNAIATYHEVEWE